MLLLLLVLLFPPSLVLNASPIPSFPKLASPQLLRSRMLHSSPAPPAPVVVYRL